jgi:hypothetical protein
MIKLRRLGRTPTVVLFALVLVVAAAGGAYAAGSGGKTITACVKKKGGALFQAKKCGKGNKKLTWNTVGPRGAAGAAGKAGSNGTNGTNGANGTNGTNGTNGAVAGLFASQSGSVDITNQTSLTTVITKTLPAGSFLINGTAGLSAGYTSSGQGVDDNCQLSDGSQTNNASWSGGMGAVFLVDVASGTVSMQLAVTSSTPSTVALKCDDALNSPPTNFSTGVSNSTISAVQTSSNS